MKTNAVDVPTPWPMIEKPYEYELSDRTTTMRKPVDKPTADPIYNPTADWLVRLIGSKTQGARSVVTFYSPDANECLRFICRMMTTGYMLEITEPKPPVTRG